MRWEYIRYKRCTLEYIKCIFILTMHMFILSILVISKKYLNIFIIIIRLHIIFFENLLTHYYIINNWAI